RAGLLHAQGRAVVLMDCDFEHPPELVPALVTEWRRGAKVVTTHRLDINSPASFGKRVTSRLFYNVLDLIGDVRIEPGSADFLLLIYSIVSFLWIGHTVAGWTSIMATIAILGAGQLLVLGIIGEYVGRILRQTRKWPGFLVASTDSTVEAIESPPTSAALRTGG